MSNEPQFSGTMTITMGAVWVSDPFIEDVAAGAVWSVDSSSDAVSARIVRPDPSHTNPKALSAVVLEITTQKPGVARVELTCPDGKRFGLTKKRHVLNLVVSDPEPEIKRSMSP